MSDIVEYQESQDLLDTVAGDTVELSIAGETVELVAGELIEVTETADPEVIEVGVPGPSGSSIMHTRSAAGPISGHRVVVEQDDGFFHYVDNDSVDQLHLRPGVTIGAASDGDPVTAIMLGRLDEPSWAWTPSVPLYLGDDGVLTQVPPTAADAVFLLQVGVALSATAIFVDPQQPIVLT